MIDHIGGYTVGLRGQREGSGEEPYVFLSVNKKIDLNSPSKKPVGIFDILGRKGMKTFVGKFLNPVPRLRRATKMEDLVQLLIFDAVQGILIPEFYVDHYKKISKLEFVVTPCPNMKTGILALGVRQGKNAALTVKALTALDKGQMAVLEVEQWR